jgi:hypothetical protein
MFVSARERPPAECRRLALDDIDEGKS